MLTSPYITAIMNARFNLTRENIWNEVHKQKVYFRKKEMINCLQKKEGYFSQELTSEEYNWLYKEYLPSLLATRGDDAALSFEK